MISPYDCSITTNIIRAIHESQLGLTPVKEQHTIHLAIPEMDGERREELIKYAKSLAETQKVAVRNIRRKYRKHESLSEKKIDEMTAQAIQEIDSLLSIKIESLKGRSFKDFFKRN